MEKNLKTSVTTNEAPKKINPTFEALVRLKGAMHTNDPKFAWVR